MSSKTPGYRHVRVTIEAVEPDGRVSLVQQNVLTTAQVNLGKCNILALHAQQAAEKFHYAYVLMGLAGD
jgi:hypothetical protein